jgi:ribonuclease R
MDFSIATLLSHFSGDKLVAGKVLEKKLGFEDEETTEKLQVALDILERIGILTKERGKYRRVQATDVVEAKLRCSSKGFCFGIQDQEDSEDIYIKESHLSNAWNGDRVLVKIIKEGSRRRSPEGEVMLIVDRANPSLLATVKETSGNYKAVPLDDRLLFELDLENETNSLEKAVEHLVHVSVLRYPLAQYPPIGQVTKVLGSDAEEAADTDIVCCKHDLPHVFSEKVIAQAEKLPSKIEQSEIEKRLDLTNLLTFTIENEDENSFVENAFSLEKKEDQQWQLGIHISDVAHYIETDSLLDRHSQKRGTAIDLQNQFLPLFPEEVIKRCSLVQGKTRLTISLFLTFDEQGEVIHFSLEPTVISVDHQLNFKQIQSLLKNPDELDDSTMTGLVESLRYLFLTLSPLIKVQRLERGSFDLALNDLTSPFKDEGRYGAMIIDSSLPVRASLTELVLLAQKKLAQHLVALGVPGIFCTQPEPDFEDLEDLLKLAKNLDLDVELDPEEDIFPSHFQHFSQEFSKSNHNKVLNFMLLSSIKAMKYSTHPGNHFALAYDEAYTHCISPGQRYGDLLVQRLIKAVFDHGRDRRNSLSKKGVNLKDETCHGQINWNVLPPPIHGEFEEYFHRIISHLNDREKVAQDAEKDLQGLKKVEKMKERTGKIFQGLITGVQSYGFFVEMEDLLVEGLVHVSSLKDDWYEYRSRHSCLVGRKNRTAYRLGDTVEVEVKSVDYYRQQIDLVTVRGGSSVTDEDLEDE